MDNIKKIASAKKKKDQKELNAFFSTHIDTTTNHMTLVLKTHLYIEHCLDQLLMSTLPKPDKMLKKTFSQKIDLFEALNLSCPPDDPRIILKLRQLNKIRNLFAHNLDKKLRVPDFNIFVKKGVKFPPKALIEQKYKYALMSFLSYFRAFVTINKFLPFYSSYFRNKEVYKKDVGWSESIILAYPLGNVPKILDFLRIKEGECFKKRK